ncbi:MAG: hypothetical protein A3G34_00025 [Candidatus Lindowbacteria bacterium RIFCSPLOWO2_12_FULL_62_27]|nr:MAG: hypothetical protein A3G34_00025 [Candidatus Lindowbacteria bacterium RIFCSPLOWO2_12_FULL_62_27]
MAILEHLLHQPSHVSVVAGSVVFAGLFFLTRSAASLSRLAFALILFEIVFVTLHYSGMFYHTVLLKDIAFQAVNFTLFLLWLGHFSDKETFRVTPTPLNGAILVFFWLGIVGAMAAPRQFWYYAMEWSVRFAAAGLFFYLIVTFVNTRRRWTIALHTYVAMVPITSIYAILQMQGLDMEKWGYAVKHATFANKDFFASFLTYTTPIALCMAIGARRPLAAAGYAISALLGLYNLWVGETRGAWLGMMVFLGLLAWFECRFGRLREWLGRRWKTVAIAALASLVVVSLGLAVMSAHRLETLQSIFQVHKGTNIIRLYMWWGASRMLWDNPWFGQGLGTSFVTFPFFRPDRYRRIGMAPSTDYVHSEPMQFLCEQGILGFSGWLAMLAVFLTVAYRRLKQTQDVADRYALFGLVGGFVGAVVHDSLNINLRYTSSMMAFWGSMALATRLAIGFDPETRKQTLQDIRRRAESVSPAHHQAVRHFVILPAAITAFAFMAYCQFRVLKGDCACKIAMADRGRSISSIPLGKTALQSNPYNPSAAYALASAYHDINEPGKTLEALGAVMQLAPNHSYTHRVIAANLMRLYFTTNQPKYLHAANLEFEGFAVMNNDHEPHMKVIEGYRTYLKNGARAHHHNQFIFWLVQEDGFFNLLRFWSGWEWGVGRYPEDLHLQTLYATYLQAGETAMQDHWNLRVEFVRISGRPWQEAQYAVKMAAAFASRRLHVLRYALGGLLVLKDPEADLLYLINILEGLRPEHLPANLCRGMRQELIRAAEGRIDSPLLYYALGVLSHRADERDMATRFFATARNRAVGDDSHARILRRISQYGY